MSEAQADAHHCGLFGCGEAALARAGCYGHRERALLGSVSGVGGRAWSALGRATSSFGIVDRSQRSCPGHPPLAGKTGEEAVAV